MESKFQSDLLGALLDNLTVRAILSGIKITLNGDTLADFWHDADEELFFYAKLNIPDETRDDSVELLAHADYLTYIPYGDEGYRFFDGYIRSKEGISAAEWRYRTFLKILGKDAQKYNPLQLERFRRYFTLRELERVRFDNIDEVAAGILRIRHNIESVMPKRDVYGGFDDVWRDIIFNLSDDLPQKKTMTMDELLRTVPQPPPLNDAEREFIISVTEKTEKIAE